MKYKTHMLTATAIIGLGAAPLSAETYQAATWLSNSSKIASEGYVQFAKDLEEASGGEIAFDVHLGGALLPAKETLQGVGRGVAQLGQITAAYVPADLPVNNVLGDLGIAVTDPFVGSFAVTEVRVKNPQIQAEWQGHNVIYAGSYATSSYYFQCTKPINNVDDVKGKKVRASVGAQVELLKMLGAVPVSVPASDIYSGLERGSIDCTLLADDALLGLKTVEAISHKTNLPMGSFMDGATWGFNGDFWAGLSAENRRLVLDEVATAIVRTQMGLTADDGRALEEAEKEGIEIFEPDDTLINARSEFLDAFIGNLAADSVEKRSIEDPSELIAQFAEAQEKWSKLLEGIDRTDEAALVALVKSEIYDQIDVESYGLK